MPRPTDIRLGDDSALLSSADEAAARVLSPLRNALAKLEQGGVLLQSPDGKYSYTTPVDQSEHGGAMGVHHPPGWKVAGIYHSHLKDDTYDRQTFSDTDLDQANTLHVPSYVLFQDSGQVRRYVPGQTPTQIQNFGGSMVKAAHGDPLPTPEPVVRAYPYNMDEATAHADPIQQQQMLAQVLRDPNAIPDQR